MKEINKVPNGNLEERLTLDEIAEHYPDQWAGLTYIQYIEDNVNIISAVLDFIDRSKNDLTTL